MRSPLIPVRIMRRNDEPTARHKACQCDILPDDCPMARELLNIKNNHLQHLNDKVRNVLGMQLMIFAALVVAIIMK